MAVLDYKVRGGVSQSLCTRLPGQGLIQSVPELLQLNPATLRDCSTDPRPDLLQRAAPATGNVTQMGTEST